MFLPVSFSWIDVACIVVMLVAGGFFVYGCCQCLNAPPKEPTLTELVDNWDEWREDPAHPIRMIDYPPGYICESNLSVFEPALKQRWEEAHPK